jgi:hypothetical protein
MWGGQFTQADDEGYAVNSPGETSKPGGRRERPGRPQDGSDHESDRCTGPQSFFAHTLSMLRRELEMSLPS